MAVVSVTLGRHRMIFRRPELGVPGVPLSVPGTRLAQHTAEATRTLSSVGGVPLVDSNEREPVPTPVILL